MTACPSCDFDKPLFVWREGEKMFASTQEGGLTGVVRTNLLICPRCGAVYTQNGYRVHQDEEYAVHTAMTKSLGEDRTRSAIQPGEGDDD